MSAQEPAITFRELLAYTDYLAQRWLNYFEQNPKALDVDVGGKTGTLRDLVAHTFLTEQFFANRVLGDSSPPPKEKPKSPPLELLRGLHQDAEQKLAKYIASASDEGLRQKQAFGPVSASNRKLLAQAMLHSVHHWAQVAMEVRQAGFPTETPQDIIISPVMD
jgi:uncharacterized damage-inducible protein DinB